MFDAYWRLIPDRVLFLILCLTILSNKLLSFKLQYFPKTEKYVPLFSGGDDSETVDNRNRLRKQIEDRLIAAAESGKDLEGFIIILFNDIKDVLFSFVD